MTISRERQTTLSTLDKILRSIFFRLLLCLLLVLPTVGTVSRPKQIQHSDSARKTEASDLQRIRASATQFYTAGNLPGALRTYESGLVEAKKRHDLHMQSRFLFGIGNCHLAAFEYTSAVREYLEARNLTRAEKDWSTTALLSVALYNAYRQMGDINSAFSSIEEVQNLPLESFDANLPRVLITLAEAESKQNHPEKAVKLYSQAIASSEKWNDRVSLAQAWGQLGYHHMQLGELPQADAALTEAFRLRKMSKSPYLATLYRDLALLRTRQGRPGEALNLAELAIAEARKMPVRLPLYSLYQTRARALEAAGDLPAALSNYETAIDYGRLWRLEVVPVDAARTGADTSLQKIYDDYLTAGMTLYARTKDQALAARLFLAAEQNRALSFRERLQAQTKLPPAYFQILDQLRRAEIDAFSSASPEAQKKVSRLRLQLVEIEAVFSLDSTADQYYSALSPRRVSHKKKENFPSAQSLNLFQKRLPPREALLSFHLGEKDAYVWGITQGSFEVHELRDRAHLAEDVARFRDSIQQDAAKSKTLAAELHKRLFGAFSTAVTSKPEWLIIPDDVIFQVPFAALRTKLEPEPGSYLVDSKSIRILPSLGMLLEENTVLKPARSFVAFADPIYNATDARWKGKAVVPVSSGAELTRLPGSGKEAQVCARLMPPEFQRQILQGVEATRGNLEHALQSGPEILHFAGHVVQSQGPEPVAKGTQKSVSAQSADAMMALGLNASGQPDFLTSEEIVNSKWNLGMVIMSGCSSGAGSALPGAGLFGLTRSWLIAGAHTVAATQWPIPDDGGVLLEEFYKYLNERLSMGKRLTPDRAADALQAAQQQMLRSKSWRSSPKYWAAFFVVGKE